LEVRKIELEVTPEEPPERHANIERWPWAGDDPAFQKARQLEKAQAIAQKSKLLVLAAAQG
jgi:hypothetical protein